MALPPTAARYDNGGVGQAGPEGASVPEWKRRSEGIAIVAWLDAPSRASNDQL
jgi:hypothetical protein